MPHEFHTPHEFLTGLTSVKFKISKDYLLSLRYYLLFAALIFIFSVGWGYLFAKDYPVEVQKVLQDLQRVLEPIKEMSEMQQVFFIFLNNSVTGFLAIFLGPVLGIFPFSILLANGGMMGIMFFLSEENEVLSAFFTGIFPHGVIEIPVLIFCGAIGIRIAVSLFKKIFRKKSDIKKELIQGLNFFFKILIPLLFLASLIEVFITQRLLI